MDISEEVRAVHRRDLHAFLEDGIYMDEIKAVLNHNRRRLIVDISDLHSYGDIGSRILRNPSDYMQSFNDAATEIANRIDPRYLKQGEQLLVGFEGAFISRRVTPRDLLSEYIGSMVCVQGIVTKCTFFLPCLLLLSFHARFTSWK